MQSTKLIFPINDGSRDYIAKRIAGRNYVKAADMSANKQYSPGGEWLLDGKKFLSLFIDQDGNQMDTGSIAQLLGVNRAVITEMSQDGKGVPESLFNDIATALYASAIGEVGRAGRLDPRTVDEYFPVVASGTNQNDYVAALGTKIWGFDYAPYWHDMTEERTVTAIGQSKENAESAKNSFSAALEDNEVLLSFMPAFEPFGFEDNYSDVVPKTPQSESVNTTYVQQGALIPEDEILEKSNFQLTKLAEALGVDPDNRLEVLQAILDAGIDVQPKTIKKWESEGVPSEAIDHLIVSGAIPSAADVFGPEFAQFDSMQDRYDVLEKLLEAIEKAGLPATAIASITNATYSLKSAREVIERDKAKNQKRIDGKEKLKISGKASKISTSQKRQLLNSFNAAAKKNGSNELTMEELFGTKRGGLSSGGKRFVAQTPRQRMTTARLQAKYPNLPNAYARVSDIPTPERLNNKGLSSGREQEIYATITANLVESMEKAIANGIEWEAPWRQGRMFPRNGMTRTRYKGINILTLMLAQEEKNYEKPIWGTFDNWKAAGGSVKKGEKGTPIIFAGYIDVEDPKNPGETKTRRTLRSYYVFNLDQVEGVDRAKFDDGMEELDSQLRVADVDQIATALGIDLRHSGDSAYFSPSEDKIVMPPFSEFKSPEDYYSTLMHEIVHWTGGRSRLDRPNMNQRNSPEYAFEELIAEIGAAYMMGILGLSVQPRGDHAHYLGHWVQKLKDDPEAIQKAVTAAQKAANWIIENVPSLKEATEKANKAAEEASAEAKKLSDEAKEARGAASTSRRPNTRRPSTRRRQ